MSCTGREQFIKRRLTKPSDWDFVSVPAQGSETETRNQLGKASPICAGPSREADTRGTSLVSSATERTRTLTKSVDFWYGRPKDASRESHLLDCLDCRHYRLRCTVLAFFPGKAMKLIDVHTQCQTEEMLGLHREDALTLGHNSEGTDAAYRSRAKLGVTWLLSLPR